MNKQEHIKYWQEIAQHDFESAKSMFDIARYDWCLFVGHLAIEKILKAIFVEKTDNKMPPKIHNLVRLSELCKINLNDSQKFYLDKINDFNLETRYPNFKMEFYKKCNKNIQPNTLIKLRNFTIGSTPY